MQSPDLDVFADRVLRPGSLHRHSEPPLLKCVLRGRPVSEQRDDACCTSCDCSGNQYMELRSTSLCSINHPKPQCNAIEAHHVTFRVTLYWATHNTLVCLAINILGICERWGIKQAEALLAHGEG